MRQLETCRTCACTAKVVATNEDLLVIEKLYCAHVELTLELRDFPKAASTKPRASLDSLD